MNARTSAAAALLCASVALWPATAEAQFDPFMPVPIPPVGPAQPAQPNPQSIGPQRGQTVIDRPRPLFDPLGVRLDEFFLYPRIELDGSYNDNIFATSHGTKSDFITDLKPRLDLVSNFGQHAFNMSAGADLGWYAGNSTENYQDAFTSASGRYDLDQGQHIFANAEVDRLHTARTAPDFPGAAAQPPIYTTYLAGLGYSQDALPVTYRGDVSVERSEYQAVPAVGGGLITASDRDNLTYTLALQGGYSVNPNWGVFVRGSGNIRSFDHGASATNPKRDSAGYHADLGARTDLGVLYGEVYLGFLEQDYQNSLYRPIRGIDGGAKVTWNVTGLDTLQLNALRSVQDIGQEVFGGGFTSPGYLHSQVALSLDHELLRNFLLNGSVSYINDDFKGVSRTDDGFDATVGAKFLLRREIYLGATYTFSHRDSHGAQAAGSFSQNILMLRIATQL